MADPADLGGPAAGSATFPPLYTPFKAVTPHLAALLLDSRVSPNALTLGWGALLVGASVCLARGSVLAAAVLVLAAVLLDCLDGDLARARHQSTISGTLLEQIAHWIGNMALALGIGAGLLLADPGPGAILLVSTLAVAQATYIAVVRQVHYESANIPEHPGLRRAFRAIIHASWLLSPIELPIVAVFLMTGVTWASVLGFTAALALFSALIFVPHFLLIRAVDRRPWTAPDAEPAAAVPEAILALAWQELDACYPAVDWWTPATPALPAPVRALLARPPMASDSPLSLGTRARAEAALPELFRTRGRVLVLGTPATTVLEAVLSSLCAPADRVLLAGTAERVQRWRVLAEGLGLAPTCVEAEAGNGVDAAALADALAEGPDPRLVLLMQSEAEDGSTADLEGLSAVLEKSASLVVVDATLGFCADDLRMDDWGLDIVFSGTESGLAAGPGLSLVALGPRALAHFGTTATGRLGIALDLRRRVGESGLPADVLPSPAIGTLWLAVSMTLTSGHDRVLTRRRNLAERFRQGCSEGAGLGILATRPSAACTVLQLPTGATIAAVQSRLLASHGMIVASGMTATGPVLRVAHHGWRSEAEIDRAVAAIVDAVSAAPGQGGQASNMPQGGKGEMT